MGQYIGRRIGTKVAKSIGLGAEVAAGREFSIIDSLTPSIIRNLEGDNVSASSTTTLLTIQAIDGNEFTLNELPASLIDTNVDWFIQSLDIADFNVPTDPSYSGDYMVQDKITSFDFNNKKITVVSTTGFAVGKEIMLYSPWPNFTFNGDQTTEGAITDSAAGWRAKYVQPGPAWYDEDLERYVMLFNGRSDSDNGQVGIAFSDDAITWTVGNSFLPIITNSDDPHFATHVIAQGNAHHLDTGRVAFAVSGFTGSDQYCHIIEMDKDGTNIAISASMLTGSIWYFNGLTEYNDKFYICSLKKGVGAVDTWTNEMWESTTLYGTYSKKCDIITTEYDDNDSVWVEGHADTLTPFVEDGVLYMFVGGTSRYRMSGLKGNREIGLMVYNDVANSWSILNDYAPEIINPYYFYNIPSEDYDWAGGHTGGFTSFIKRNKVCYLFISCLFSSNTYQVAAMKLR